MKFKIFIIAFAILAAMLITACSSDEPTPAPVPEPAFTDLNLSEAESRANEGLMEFNNIFFKKVAAEVHSPNYAVSPLGASMLLSLTCNVTDRELSAQILSVLGSSDTEALNTLARRYMEVLPVADPDVTMTIGNGCWYSDRYTLANDFAGILTDSYDGFSCAGNFTGAPELVVRDINSWVSERTAGMIPSILSEEEEALNTLRQMCAVLVDAIYLKGAWCEPFDKAKTKAAVFHGEQGDSNVEMMYRKGRAFYQIDNTFTALRLPLGDGLFNVTFVLPNGDNTISQLIDENIHDRLATNNSLAVEMYIPKVDFAGNTINLTEIFDGMGITLLNEFREISMFNERVEAQHHISQKAAVCFNEDGAEASAVTWNDMHTTPEPGYEPQPPVFRADRPFLFFIDEATTGAALLWGCIRQL